MQSVRSTPRQASAQARSRSSKSVRSGPPTGGPAPSSPRELDHRCTKTHVASGILGMPLLPNARTIRT